MILFAGALEHMFRPADPDAVRLVQPALGRPAGRQGRGRLRWSSSASSSSCSTPPSASRCRCCSPASPASIPSAPASSTSASRARCWPAPSPPAPSPRSPASAWLGLARRRSSSRSLLRAGPRLRLDHPARQPDRLRRRHQLPRRRARPSFLGQAWFGQGGRTPQLDRRRALRARSRCPVADASSRRADPRPDLFRADLRPQPPRLSRLPRGAAHLVGALPHPLRPAPARRRREPRGRRHRRHLGDLAALPRRDHHRHALRHRRRLSLDRADRRLRATT